MRHVKAFVSYSHDSQEHEDAVLALADRLRREGIDCNLDQYEEAPVEGWPRWMVNQVEWADYVLIVCTEKYERRFRGREAPNKGLGASWEGALITQEIYNAASNTTKFIPVVLNPGDAKFIPVELQGATRYDLSEIGQYFRLYRRLTGQPHTPRPPLGEITPLPERERKLPFAAEPTAPLGVVNSPQARDGSPEIRVPASEAAKLMEQVERLKELLTNRCTNDGPCDDEEFKALRRTLCANSFIRTLLPSFVQSCRSLDEFWGFIKPKESTYAGRREYLRESFDQLLTGLEDLTLNPSESKMENPAPDATESDERFRNFTLAVVPQTQGYSAICLDLGLTGYGVTPQEALESVRTELQAYLANKGMPADHQTPILTQAMVLVASGTVSAAPDSVGLLAGRFVRAVYISDIEGFWSQLSHESHGIWKGIWSKSEGWDLGDVDIASRHPSTPRFAGLIMRLMESLATAWGPEWGGDELSVAPTRYESAHRARVRVLKGFADVTVIATPTRMEAIVVPMVCENGLWKVDYLGLITPASLASNTVL
ncbi:MAG TPA: SEFIR domain-containing protein [Symbiobacteriaceae bacterium]|nr:SEFIR domain-containing protein [Symbiobacteriaceae bacterium]